MKTGLQIAQFVKQQLVELTHLKPDTISSFSKDDQGWHVYIEMIEMKRIPDATDMLATYETLSDEEGNIINFHRTRRYLRDATMEKEE
ncbi:MAG: gas vesicle protein [Chloroflexi bacterium]|nr:gas vesicle protein [Chloroflexota bacterium]